MQTLKWMMVGCLVVIIYNIVAMLIGAFGPDSFEITAQAVERSFQFGSLLIILGAIYGSIWITRKIRQKI